MDNYHFSSIIVNTGKKVNGNAQVLNRGQKQMKSLNFHFVIHYLRSFRLNFCNPLDVCSHWQNRIKLADWRIVQKPGYIRANSLDNFFNCSNISDIGVEIVSISGKRLHAEAIFGALIINQMVLLGLQEGFFSSCFCSDVMYSWLLILLRFSVALREAEVVQTSVLSTGNYKHHIPGKFCWPC